MISLHERQPMHRTRQQAQEAMFKRFDPNAKAEIEHLRMVRSINTLVDQKVDTNPLQEISKEKRNDNHVRDILRIAAAGVVGATAGAALTDTLPAAAQTNFSTKDQAIVWEMPSNFPTSERAYQQMLADHSKSRSSFVKQSPEKTPVARNYEQLGSLELITDATLESASISGTDIAMIQTFKDGTRHLIAGSLIDPNRPPIDMGTLPINPLKVARQGNIIVAVGGQLSSLDQGAVWISMDGGKTGITVTDADGQFLEVSIPDTESVFLVEGNRMAENQPAYLKMISLARPTELKPLGAANPASTSDALRLQSVIETYRISDVDYRNFGYWVKIIQSGKIVSSTLKAQEWGFIMSTPLQFYDTDGKIVDAVINGHTRGIPPNPDVSNGSIVYIKEGQEAFLIQPWQELFGTEGPVRPITALFNPNKKSYMAVTRSTTVIRDGRYYVAHIPDILELDNTDLKDFTKQKLITITAKGFPGIGTPNSLHVITNSQGQDTLFAVLSTGVYKQLSNGSWEQVNIYRIASDPPTPTPTPTPTFTPTPTPTQQDKYPHKVRMPMIRKSAQGNLASGGW